MRKQSSEYFKEYISRPGNRQKKAEVNKRWYLRNKDQVKRKNKSYQQSEPGRVTCTLATYKYNAKDRGLCFEITKEQYMVLRSKPCFYCNKPGPNGLDRIDNSKGYTTENVVPSCYRHNAMKSDMTMDEFIEACKEVSILHGGLHWHG